MNLRPNEELRLRSGDVSVVPLPRLEDAGLERAAEGE